MIESEAEARAYSATLCDVDAVARLEQFIDLLAAENARQNLISNKSLESVWQRHIADSLQLLAHVPRETSPWMDLGSGAGMPGLVLAIARPDLEIHLVESRKKRVQWLEGVAKHFGLEKCHVHGSRLENVESAPMRVICARAFAPLGKLLSLSARFSTQETVWLLPKGRSAGQELMEQPESVRKMFHVEQSATDPQAGIMIGLGRPPIQ